MVRIHSPRPLDAKMARKDGPFFFGSDGRRRARQFRPGLPGLFAVRAFFLALVRIRPYQICVFFAFQLNGVGSVKHRRSRELLDHLRGVCVFLAPEPVVRPFPLRRKKRAWNLQNKALSPMATWTRRPFWLLHPRRARANSCLINRFELETLSSNAQQIRQQIVGTLCG